MTRRCETQKQIIAALYTAAAALLNQARDNVALHDWCLKNGEAPPFQDEDEARWRRLAAMRDVEALLNEMAAVVSARGDAQT